MKKIPVNNWINHCFHDDSKRREREKEFLDG